jgi:hypothetical protein
MRRARLTISGKDIIDETVRIFLSRYHRARPAGRDLATD